MKQQSSTTEQAWLEYKNGLLSFIRAKISTIEDAEDILNEVFTALIEQTNINKTPDNIAAWLYRVSRNRIVDYYRAKKTFDSLPDDLTADLDSANIDPGAITSLSKCILPMIHTLPINYQQPLILSEIEGKKNREVAKKLGLTLPAVKSRILRGRQQLYQSLVDCCAIYRDSAGNVVDFHQISSHFCHDSND